MNTFWKNLNRMAQDQLFAGGYLAPGTVATIAAKRKTSETPDRASCAQEKQPNKRPWPRLAALR